MPGDLKDTLRKGNSKAPSEIATPTVKTENNFQHKKNSSSIANNLQNHAKKDISVNTDTKDDFKDQGAYKDGGVRAT